MNFGIIATILGFVVDAISIYHIIAGKDDEPKGKNHTNNIMLIIGTLAIVIGLIGIFGKGFLSDKEEDVVSSDVPPIVSEDVETGDASTDSENETTNNNTADIDTPESTKPEDVKSDDKIWIDQMQVFAYDSGLNNNGSYRLEDVILSNTGDNLNHALVFRALDVNYGKNVYWQSLEYYLNGNYSNFNGTLALSDNSKATKGGYILEIQFDDETTEKYQITNGFVPVELNLDVSSVKIMKIYIVCTKTGHDHAEIAFGDAFFTKKQ